MSWPTPAVKKQMALLKYLHEKNELALHPQMEALVTDGSVIATREFLWDTGMDYIYKDFLSKEEKK